MSKSKRNPAFRVLSEITRRSPTTKRAISYATNLCFATVSQYINQWKEDGLFSTSHPKAGQKHNQRGRKTEIIAANPKRLYLCIDLTSKNFTYSLSPLAFAQIKPEHFYYVDDLDYFGNISLLAHEIREYCGNARPYYTIVAFPGIYDAQRDILCHCPRNDYAMNPVKESLHAFGLFPDRIVSSTDAAAAYLKDQAPHALIFLDENVYGYTEPSSFCCFNSVFINARQTITLQDVLFSQLNDAKTYLYLSRFFATFSNMDTFIITNTVSQNAVTLLLKEYKSLHDITEEEPVLKGLMLMAVESYIDQLYPK